MIAQGFSAIADAWEKIVRSNARSALPPEEASQAVEGLVRDLESLLDAGRCQRQEDVDALARRILSLDLPSQAIGQLQTTLLEKVVGHSAETEGPSTAHALIGELTASLLRQKSGLQRRGPEPGGGDLSAGRAAPEMASQPLDTEWQPVPAPLALWSPDGELTYVNEALLTRWGYDRPEAVVGREASVLWGEEPSLDTVQRAVEEEGRWVGKVMAARADGGGFATGMAVGAAEGGGQAEAFAIACFSELGERDQLGALLRRRIQRLRVLRRVDRDILSATRPEEIAKAALGYMAQLVGCQRASVSLFHPGDERATFLAAVPRVESGMEPEAGMRLAGFEEALKALEQGQVQIIADLRRLSLPEATRQTLQPRKARTLLVVPMCYERELMGALNLSYRDPGEVRDRCIAVAREVADSLAVAIHHAQLGRAIARREEQLETLTARLAEAEEAERRRLARALHDQIGQQLTALGINLNVMKARLDPRKHPEFIARLDDSLELLKETTERVRRIIADLRPPMLDDYGLLPTLRWCGEQLKARADVNVVVEGEEPQPRLGSPIEDALVRITQEALTNVAKHADASRVTIALSEEEDTVRLEVVDNGVGVDAEKTDPQQRGGWGIISMRERAEAIGGQCRVVSKPGGGTRVTVEVER